jgi:hypothetical protein
MDQVPLSRLPVNNIDVCSRPVASSVERGSPVIIGPPNSQEKVDPLFRAPFEKNPFVFEFKFFWVSL